MTDARDVGTPGKKEWAEFEATIAPFFLMAWLLGEIDDVAPNYVSGLEARFLEGFDNAAALELDDPEYDGAVLLQAYSGHGVTLIDRAEAELLHMQLFPHKDAEGDFRYLTWGAVIIGVHGALEAYAVAVGVEIKRKSLPAAVQGYVARQSPGTVFPASLADRLEVLHNVRHLFVHNRGIVDDGFINNTKNNRLLPGERFPLDEAGVGSLTQAAWKTAALLAKIVAEHNE